MDVSLATYREPPIVVAGETGRIVVEGTITVGHTNYALEPVLHRLTGGRYLLTVEARSAGIGLAIAVGYRYRAVLRPWPAGAYRLDVIELLPDGSRHRIFADAVVVK